MIHTTRTLNRATLALALLTACALPVQGQAQDGMIVDSVGNVGIGIDTPARLLHLKGSDAVFRMDRPSNTSAFMLVRTNAAGAPLKTFVVGANASAANNGEFVINDLGAAVGGAGTNRMTITNAGDTKFFGKVQATAFVQSSSIRYKDNVETIAEANRSIDRLRGVRFSWKESGEKSLGLIAEEVSQVFPELVAISPDTGQAEGINYAALSGVLVEAIKEQHSQISAQQTALSAYEEKIASQQSQLNRLEARLADFDTLRTRLNEIQALLNKSEPVVASLQTR